MSFNSTASMSGGCESRAKAGQLSFKVQVKGRALSNSRARSRARIISSEKEAVFPEKKTRVRSSSQEERGEGSNVCFGQRPGEERTTLLRSGHQQRKDKEKGRVVGSLLSIE